MNNSSQDGVVHKTKDYTQFKFLEYNRPLMGKHIDQLVESIKLSNDLKLNPIIVTSEMEIVDGQHRLKAAEKLGVDIYYLIDDDFEPSKIIQLNTTQKNWQLENYLHYWIEHGKEDYIKLSNFMKDMGFSLNIVLKWIDGFSGRDLHLFRRGVFKFKVDKEVLEKMILAKKLVGYFLEKRIRRNSIANQSALHKAMYNFFFNPLIDSERFFDRLSQVPFEIKFSFTWQTYFEQFVDIYNWNIREKNRIKMVQDGDSRELAV